MTWIVLHRLFLHVLSVGTAERVRDIHCPIYLDHPVLVCLDIGCADLSSVLPKWSDGPGKVGRITFTVILSSCPER